MKKASIIAAVILIAAGLALFAGAFAASGYDFSKLGTESYETTTYSVNEDFQKIEISSREADILFRPSADGRFSVVCFEPEKVKHTVSVEAGTLKIGTDDQRSWIDRLGIFSKTHSMTVSLPLREYDSLTVGDSTGDVSIPDAFSFKSAAITTSTGDVEFFALTSGPLKIKTSTGDIRLDHVRTDELDLSVSTGHIEAGSIACEGTITVEVSTGKTELKDVTCKSFYSSGDTGDITLENTVVSDTLEIERDTGDVRFENSDAGELTIRTSTGDVTGTLRTEKVFLTQSSTGSIHVPETTSGGKCKITTNTGKIRIELSAD